ncbi:UNVERIFIED_CONTAM: hypothetical protein Scaly_2784800 [Sesamum calycinum]|uniref:Uncharacterized protein n=1 Tax=Sesamum calycinum TaxID=2727403 RepID=A0AAW2IWQ7_9LAMI
MGVLEAVTQPPLQDEQTPPALMDEDRFQDVVHVAEQLLWNCCTHSHLGAVVELVDIKRLYASEATASQMTSHANHQTEEGSMCHPSDVEAWRYFNQTYPNFAVEPRNDPLIKEMQNFWHVGVLTRDNVKNEIFAMRVTLIWIVNNLPACGMASAWSTAGVMRCPICMEDTCAFYLQNDRKAATLIATNNSSPTIILTIEKDIFDNIFITVINITGKKDNLNARKDLKIICNRPELKVDEARCVDMKELRLHDMNNYDCHVFMQKLIRITFRDMLLESVWSALTEVSFLFQILYSTMLDVNKVQELKATVAII